MLETAIEMPVVRRAEAAGFFVRKVQWPGRRHAPDRIFAHERRGIVFIEFKRPGESPRVGQRREHERMRKAGIEVHVCDSVQDALHILGLTPGHNGGPPLNDWEDMV